MVSACVRAAQCGVHTNRPSSHKPPLFGTPALPTGDERAHHVHAVRVIAHEDGSSRMHWQLGLGVQAANLPSQPLGASGIQTLQNPKVGDTHVTSNKAQAKHNK